MRTRWVPIRTLSLMPMTVKITIEQTVPLYQKLAPKIRELKTLGMSINEIASILKISRKTINKGLDFIHG